MYKVIICDDSPTFVKLFNVLMEPYAEVYDFEIISFGTGGELLEYCRSNPFDIVYMDIRLDESRETPGGIDYAKMLKIINPRSLTIYITSYDTYYRSVVNAEPFRLIEKDMYDMEKFRNRLVEALDDAVRRLLGGRIWTYTYRRQQYGIEFAQIVGIYSSARKIHIISLKKLEQDFYYGKLDEVRRALENDSPEFVQINKKTIVNVLYVKRIKEMKDKVCVGNKIFTVAPEYKKSFDGRYLRYGRDIDDVFV